MPLGETPSLGGAVGGSRRRKSAHRSELGNTPSPSYNSSTTPMPHHSTRVTLRANMTAPSTSVCASGQPLGSGPWVEGQGAGRRTRKGPTCSWGSSAANRNTTLSATSLVNP